MAREEGVCAAFYRSETLTLGNRLQRCWPAKGK